MSAFIVFEGGEGSGKSTVVREVAKRCRNVVVTREPGGSAYAEKIRELILSDDASHADAETLFLLFWAARRDHVQNTVIPACNEGKVVISDRFDCSTYAYQLFGQEQHRLENLFWTIREYVLEECTPDVYVLLDIDPSEGLKRVHARSGTHNHLDARDVAFHTRVHEGLHTFITHHAQRGEILDASQPLHAVVADACKIVQQYTPCN